mmetsp:Transcript_78739/g.132085  ORF Transcript_78739/g.132085 Transcript_78739/m.132085 type:complete len:249 (+) Transcript_78739:39-785(+)
MERRRRGTQHPPWVQMLVNTGARLPPAVELALPNFQVHSQGDRGTCCGHAVTAAHEVITGRCFNVDDIFDASWDDDAERTIGDKFNGAHVRDCCALLATDGQRELNGRQGIRHRYQSVLVPPGDVKEARLRLIGGSPIAVGLNCIGAVQETRSGVLTCANHSRSKIPNPEWHAVTIVGFQLNEQEEGGGLFTFINSWGTQWGKAGFGTMSFAFYSQHCYESFALIPSQPCGGGSGTRPKRRKTASDSR